jgi:DNA-binding PadR family transcriptional regulator
MYDELETFLRPVRIREILILYFAHCEAAMPRTPSRRPESALPLKPADFHILMVLMRGELHGYGIMQAVAEESRGRVELEVGSLYRLISRLMDEGLIAAGRSTGRTDDRRRYYRITRFGEDVARLEAERLADVLAVAKSLELIND